MDRLLVKIETLRSMCLENLGSKEIREISVDLPFGPLDELYFRKAISWCYVLFHETGPFFRFSGRLLRSDPGASEAFGKTKNFIDCARTAHAHNLSQEIRSDQAKRRAYDIWMLGNGGKPTSWDRCCQALIKEVDHALSLVQEAYGKRNENIGDKANLWDDYRQERRTSWEAHEFDPFVEAMANEMKIDGLDCVQFRNADKRLDKWRVIVAMFDTREAAENAIGRAIRAELVNIFGIAL
jgi:hypothetical protein